MFCSIWILTQWVSETDDADDDDPARKENVESEMRIVWWLRCCTLSLNDPIERLMDTVLILN